MVGLEPVNTRLFDLERRTVALEGESLRLINEVTVLSARSNHPRVPASSTPTIDTKGIGKPDHYNGDPTRFCGWSFKLKSLLSTLGP